MNGGVGNRDQRKLMSYFPQQLSPPLSFFF